MKVVFIIVLIVVVFAFLHHVFPLIQVIGDSMYPTYLDGEIIVGTKLYRKSKLKKGDVVLYQSPTDDKTVIKRIDQIEKRGKVLYFYYYGFKRFGPLNKNCDSLMVGTPKINIVSLSTPIANPPCGGQPYLKNSR